MPPTLIPVTFSMFKVTATFDPTLINSPIPPLSTDIGPEGLSVDPGLTMIVIELFTSPSGEFGPAKFQTNPVQWLTAEGLTTPVLVPDMYMIQRVGDFQVTLLNFNSNLNELGESILHNFHLVVYYNGQTYGSDPIIVNEPPDPPVPDDGRRHRTTDRAVRESPRPAVKSRTRGAKTSAR